MSAVNYPYTPLTRIGPAANSYTLPAFSLAHTWTGVSQLITSYNLTNTSNLALQLPLDPPAGNYALVIKWVDDDGTHRYKLFDDGVTSLTYDIYDGETIGTSAVLEIWSASATTPAVMEEDFTFYTSQFNEVSCDATNCTNASGTNTTLA